MSKFKKNPNGTNELLEAETWYISYCANPCIGMPFFEADNGSDETALKAPDGTWYILNGDFRTEYEAVFENGFAACLEVYNKHKNSGRSSWSTD